jgi:hypothetical protein
MPRTRVLFLGDSNNRDFADQVAFLERLCDVGFEKDVAAACRRLCVDPVDLVVVAAAWPGECPHNELEALRGAAPFTPILTLLSAWCEGEARTGKSWPGAVRLYAHQFIPRLAAQLVSEFDRSEHGFECWSPPFSQTHEDRLLRDGGARCQSSPRLTIAICAPTRDAGVALADVFSNADFTPVMVGHIDQLRRGNCEAIVWDCGAGLDQEMRLLKAWEGDFGDAPLVLLLGFPRPGDYDLAKELNAAAIVSKPFLLEDLVCTVRRVVATKKGVAEPAAEVF